VSSASTFVWLVEWEDSIIQPRRVELRHVTRLPGVSDEDLERHLIEEEIPAQAKRATRAGGVSRQVLLRLTGARTQATGFANTQEGVAVPLGDAAISVGWNADIVWSSD